MGLWQWLKQLLFGSTSVEVEIPTEEERQERRPTPKLTPLRYHVSSWENHLPWKREFVSQRPYRFACNTDVWGMYNDGYVDLSLDANFGQLERWGLPKFSNPEELAEWLGLPVGRVAWLADRVRRGDWRGDRATDHYYRKFVSKRRGGWRLLEAPKPATKAVQYRILSEILERVPPHPAAHGFVRGRSIVTNARPHAGQAVLVKLDLENFYTSVSYARVVAIFRRLGYSREAAIWLARLTTTQAPENLQPPHGKARLDWRYTLRHLPQGAPTSPALANLAAFSLDVRLSGMARSFGAQYTRYADDLTFSGPKRFLQSLDTFLPLVIQIIQSERFWLHVDKTQIVRRHRRQVVTGVVVNERPTMGRREFKQLEAILYNCVRHGPAGQNRSGIPDFRSHLMGRVAHARQLDRRKGDRLMDLFQQIDWS